ncbi:MAG: EscU/YscU/HrcU family type III secretion system export apparatus switch protein, partial [Methylocystis sp.]|nr:EscU/YscU/HrcU family type III secretion system export apparatus switch protein [Methylocystis sp.]
MSDAEEADSRTEEASEKKIRDTLEQGKTPNSRDTATAFSVVAFLILLSFVVQATAPDFVGTLSLLLANSGQLSLRTDSDATNYGIFLVREIGRFLAPTLIFFAIAGLAGSAVQGAPRIVFDRIAPDFERISPIAGWRRIFGLSGVVDLAKAIAKIAIVGGAIAFSAFVDQSALVGAMRSEPARLPSITLDVIIHLTSVVAIAIGLL